MPKNFAEKNEFRALVRSMNTKQGVNFEEALKNAPECFKTNTLNNNIETIFANPKASDDSTDQTLFWSCVRALKQFYGTN